MENKKIQPTTSLAHNYATHLLTQPVLCVIVGVAGTGKSTLAEHLAKALHNSTSLSKDLIQDCFTNDREGETYQRLRIPTYRVLVAFADKQLALGKSTIIDAPFSKPLNFQEEFATWPTLFEAMAIKNNARFVIIRCKTPSDNALKARIENRNAIRDQEKLVMWKEFITAEPQDFCIPHPKVYELITDKDPALLATTVLEKILNAKRIV